MIEPIMYFAIGFLVATLLGLVIIPLVHNRAVRLTIRRFEAATPLSLAEIQADKDQLRAEFAMAMRRLEITVEQLKAQTTSQLAELGKKTTAINRLKTELSEKSATIFALEAREKSLRDQTRSTEDEVGNRSRALEEASRALTNKQAELATLTAALDQHAVLSDSQRAEIASLRAEVEVLRSDAEQRERELAEIAQRLDRERTDSDAASQHWSEEHTKVEILGARASELEQALHTQSGEAETLMARLEELEAQLSERGRRLIERDYETAQLRRQLEGAQRQIAAMQQGEQPLSTQAQGENALLQERISDVASEIARLTAALEGPDSPIEALLASRTDTPTLGRAPQPEPAERETLADRIRALQAHVSRAAGAR
jgi:predicted RNase H-like nuclease (RuvC/YqgF family)